MSRHVLSILFLLLVQQSWGMKTHQSPVRKVAHLLEQMQEQVSKEGNEEEKHWDKMQCYCKDSIKAVQNDIDHEESRLPALKSDMLTAESQKARLESEKERASKDKVDAQAALKSAQEMRNKDAAEYKTYEAETQSHLDAVDAAIAAVEKGLGGSFLQTSEADYVRQLVTTGNIRSSDRDVLAAAFLQERSSAAAPSASMVVGILQSMRDGMAEDAKTAAAREAEAVETFLGMAKAKAEQIALLDAAIESQTTRIGQLQVDIVNMQADVDAAAQKNAEDTKFLRDLKDSCVQQEQDWKLRQQTRADELQAIRETLEMLNSEEARDLMSKAIPGAPSPAPAFTFLQVNRADPEEQVSKARRVLEGNGDAGSGAGDLSRDPRVALLALAMRSGKIDFSKIKDRVDDMIRVLKKEQRDDDNKRKWCEDEQKSSDDSLKKLQEDSMDLMQLMEEAQSEEERVAEEIATLQANIKDLDTRMDEATKQRRQENQEYQEALVTNNKAKELLRMAQDRLSRFYEESKASSGLNLLVKRRQAMADRVAAATAAISAAGAGLRVASERTVVLPPALVQVSSVSSRPELEPKPKEFGDYEKQSGKGVVAAIGSIVQSLDRDHQAMETQESHAQTEYERITKDAQEAREADTRDVAEKSGVKAGLEKRYETLLQKNVTNQEDQFEVQKYLVALNKDCEFLLKNYEARRDARYDEQASLKRAKDILSEAR
eukprot:gb/GFBE01052613.1/.p1 GENE.gb/GFBE01052613.1/~~gb/GFBE01052613.1/.p1  ORF type:complete len:717 (+),score=222.41 gb/GFBE01052613.1/:1-2151(+)